MKLALVFVTIATLVTAGFAFADQPEILKIDVCHLDGQSGNYSLVNVNIHSVDDANGLNGHGDHDGDAWAPFTYGGVDYPGQGDMENCDEQEPQPNPIKTPTSTPTEEPTPTDAPQPPPTPTTEEPQPTPTPTDPGCERDCEPTETPTDPPLTTELPSAGFTSQYEVTNLGTPWLVFVNEHGTQVWAGHNGEDDWPATSWWRLWIGVEVYLDFVNEPAWYRVVSYNPNVATNDVAQMYDTQGTSVLLITCRSYDATTNIWQERLVVGLVRSDG